MRAMLFRLLPRQVISRGFQMFDTGLGALESPWDEGFSLRNQSRPPEVALHFDLVERDWLQGIIGTLVRLAFTRKRRLKPRYQ